MIDLSGRVAVVSGCGRSDGLGAAIARQLAALGASVVVSDIGAVAARHVAEPVEAASPDGWEGLPSLERELRAGGAEAITEVVDISREADVERLVRTTIERFGRADILVNNAAAPQGRDRAPLESTPVDAFEQVAAVNLRGCFLMSRAFLPVMRDQGYGRVVNISSIAAVIGMPSLAAYSATKAGILGLTRAMAVEVGGSGITVNAICPGRMITSRTSGTIRREGLDAGAEMERRRSLIPVGWVGTTEHVAPAVAFLASEQAAYITGQALTVDGGETLQ